MIGAFKGEIQKQFERHNVSPHQFLRITVGLILLLCIIYIYVPKLIFVYSISAVVSAPVLRLVAPIEGLITKAPSEELGTEFKTGDVLLRIENTKHDEHYLENLKIQKQTLESKIKESGYEIEQTRKLREKLQKTLDGYNNLLQQKVSINLKQAESSKVENEKRLEERMREFARQKALYEKKIVTKSVYEAILYETERLKEDIKQSDLLIEKYKVELEAGKMGVFASDTIQVPYQAQRTDELDMKITVLENIIKEHEDALKVNELAIKKEEKRLKDVGFVEIKAPHPMTLWRNFVREGHFIDAKAPFIEVLDCRSVYVSLTLSEKEFEHIKPGQKATIRLKGAKYSVQGHVTSVLGGALANSGMLEGVVGNVEIRRNYELQVLVKINEQELTQTKGDFCHVGRHGDVVFEDMK